MNNTKAIDYFGAHIANNRKLGKHAPKIDPKGLKLSTYMKAVPKAPNIFDPDAKNILFPQAGWGAMLNDSLGDCTCAAMGHVVEWWQALAQRKKIVIGDGDILAAYEAVGGYVPGDPSTDNGANELDCMNYWKSTGVAGHKIVAHATINHEDLAAIKQATFLFGATYTGVMLPAAAQNFGDRWDLPAGQKLTGDWEPGSWGGHAVPIISYDNGVAAIITWGKRVKVTWAFIQAYFDEIHAPLALDWIAGKAAPNGFNVAALADDLQQLNFDQSRKTKAA